MHNVLWLSMKYQYVGYPLKKITGKTATCCSPTTNSTLLFQEKQTHS